MERRAIVLDNGSDTIRAGFSGEELPQAEFSTMCGRRRAETYGRQDTCLGDAINKVKSGHSWLDIKKPVKDRTVRNWQDMETMWKYAFGELSVDPSQHSVLMNDTENPFLETESERAQNLFESRNAAAEIMFEKFNVPSLRFCNQSALALYGTGRINGLVLDMGESIVQVVPILNGKVCRARVKSFQCDLTSNLQMMINSNGEYRFTTLADKRVLVRLKETFCYVAQDFVTEKKLAQAAEKKYELPDGQLITIVDDHIKCGEAFFRPLYGYFYNIPEVLNKCVLGFQNTDIYSILYENIVLAGGTSMLSGFSARLRTEMGSMVTSPWKERLHVVAREKHRSYLSWFGGSLLASLGQNDSAFVSKKEFQEYGAYYVKK